MPKRVFQLFQRNENLSGEINDIKNGLIIIFIIIGLYVVLDMRDHNFKRAVDACVAGSQKLSETKITDLNEAKKLSLIHI